MKGYGRIAVPVLLAMWMGMWCPASVWAQRYGTADGLPSATVLSVLQSRTGFLWAGTSLGLARFDGRSFRVFDEGLVDRSIKFMLEEDAGTLLVGTEAGLYRFFPKTGAFRSMEVAGPVTALVHAGPGAFLAVVNGQVVRGDADGAASVLLLGDETPLSAGRAWHVSYGAQADAWVSRPEKGLLHVDVMTGDVLEERPWPDGRAHEFPNLFVTSSGLVISSVDATWRVDGTDLVTGRGFQWLAASDGYVGTRQGLRTPDGDAVFLPDPDRTESLGNVVLALTTDTDGGVWLGTRAGLFRWAPSTEALTDRWLPGVPVMSGWGGTAVAGTYGQGLRVEGATVPSDPCSPIVWSVLQEANGAIWAGTDDGVCRVGSGGDHGLASGTIVNALVQTPDGEVWAGTDRGVCRIHEGCRSMLVFDDVRQVQALAVADSGLWIGSRSGRLFKWVDPGTHTSPRLVHDLTAMDRPVGEGFWHITDTGNDVWVAASSGLIRTDSDGSGRGDVVSDELVYGTVQDASGRMWASTGRGIARMHDGGGLTFLGSLGQAEYNRRAVWASADSSELFFGGMDGVTRLVSSSFPDHSDTVPMAVTDVRVTGRDSSWTLPSWPAGGLVLTHNHVSSAVSFAALSYADTETVQYRYRLSGFDDAWVEAPGATARYTNLPPGRYALQVEARLQGGDGPAATLNVPVTVLRAWYATWWFRLLAVAAVAGLTGLAWRARVAHVRAMERVRLRMAGDLHDDVGSRLAGIALLSELVASQATLDDEQQSRLETVSATARELVTSVRDIAWLVNPERDRLEDFADRLREAASQLLADRDWHVRAPSVDGALPMTHRRHLYLACREAMHNISRHAGPGDVDIHVQQSDGRIWISIRDEGRGFDASTVPYGHGVEGMRARLADIGGQATVRSEPGKGTTVILEVSRP